MIIGARDCVCVVCVCVCGCVCVCVWVGGGWFRPKRQSEQLMGHESLSSARFKPCQFKHSKECKTFKHKKWKNSTEYSCSVFSAYTESRVSQTIHWYFTFDYSVSVPGHLQTWKNLNIVNLYLCSIYLFVLFTQFQTRVQPAPGPHKPQPWPCK